MKKTKIILSLILSLIIFFSFASCSDDTSGSMAEMSNGSNNSQNEISSASSSSPDIDKPDIDKNADFVLLLSAVPSETEAGVINAVITLSNIKNELSAIQFSLEYSSNVVEGIYTTNDEMSKTMTVVPMYKTKFDVSVPRFEQICVYNKASSRYDCMYVDLLSYPQAADGQTFKGMINDGEMVITIPFKVKSDASVGNIVKFNFVSESVKGTKTETFSGAVGSGNNTSYTLTDKDIAK